MPTLQPPTCNLDTTKRLLLFSDLNFLNFNFVFPIYFTSTAENYLFPLFEGSRILSLHQPNLVSLSLAVIIGFLTVL